MEKLPATDSLLAALAPFADYALEVERCPQGRKLPDSCPVRGPETGRGPTLGDCRLAASLVYGSRWRDKANSSLLTAKQIQDAREYESRLFGGAYSASRLHSAAKDAPIRAMIRSARETYNTLRFSAGLAPVTDWSQPPAKRIADFAPQDTHGGHGHEDSPR